MKLKIFCGLAALLLLVAFLAPPLFKLKDAALGVVLVIGVVLAAIDLWQSIFAED